MNNYLKTIKIKKKKNYTHKLIDAMEKRPCRVLPLLSINNSEDLSGSNLWRSIKFEPLTLGKSGPSIFQKTNSTVPINSFPSSAATVISGCRWRISKSLSEQYPLWLPISLDPVLESDGRNISSTNFLRWLRWSLYPPSI